MRMTDSFSMWPYSCMPEAMAYLVSWKIMSTLRRPTFHSSVVCVCSSLLLLLWGLRPQHWLTAEVAQLLKFTLPTGRAVWFLEPTYRLPWAFGIPVSGLHWLPKCSAKSCLKTRQQNRMRLSVPEEQHLSLTSVFPVNVLIRMHVWHTLTHSPKTKTLWKY